MGEDNEEEKRNTDIPTLKQLGIKSKMKRHKKLPPMNSVFPIDQKMRNNDRNMLATRSGRGGNGVFLDNVEDQDSESITSRKSNIKPRVKVKKKKNRGHPRMKKE